MGLQAMPTTVWIVLAMIATAASLACLRVMAHELDEARQVHDLRVRAMKLRHQQIQRMIAHQRRDPALTRSIDAPPTVAEAPDAIEVAAEVGGETAPAAMAA